MPSARPITVVTLAALVLGVTGCFPMPVSIPSAPRALDAATLEGEWFVVATNFPMWLDGEKCDPRFRYSQVRTRDGSTTMDDEVSYLEPGQATRSTLLGTDLQDLDQPAHFTWRGDGALSLITSEWYVARRSPDGRVAVIFFTETVATPAGVDVITRSAEPTESDVRLARAWLDEDAFLRDQSEGLVWLRGPARSASAPCPPR